MSNFELFIDDDNEVKFDVVIEGTDSGSVSSRLILEARSGFELGFDSERISSGEIFFVVPSLKGIVSEGSVPARLEVFIDDRRFIPLDLTVSLKKSVKVEAAVRTTRVNRKPSVRAVLSEDSVSTVNSRRSSRSSPRKSKKAQNLESLISEIERKS